MKTIRTRIETLERTLGIGPALDAEIVALLAQLPPEEAQALIEEFARTRQETHNEEKSAEGI